jgi:hypothetical protein
MTAQKWTVETLARLMCLPTHRAIGSNRPCRICEDQAVAILASPEYMETLEAVWDEARDAPLIGTDNPYKVTSDG